jgi:hypothetical protein
MGHPTQSVVKNKMRRQSLAFAFFFYWLLSTGY